MLYIMISKRATSPEGWKDGVRERSRLDCWADRSFCPRWVVAYSGGCMLSSAHAQIIAQLARPIVFAVRAVWFAVPALRGLGKAKALIAILSAHLFRYVTLLMYSAKHDGYAISDIAAAEAVIGDIAGAAVGLVTLGSLDPPWRPASVALSWLLVAANAVDFTVGIHRKIAVPLSGGLPVG